MHPILTVLQLGPRSLPIASYGALVCLGIAVAALGTLRAAQRAKADVGAAVALIGAALAGGFAGALVLHGIVQWLRSGSLPVALAAPGLASFGALLGMAAVLASSRSWLDLPVLAILERALPTLVLGQALGRVGCFLGGCCFGSPWDGPLAVEYSHALAPAAVSSVGRHPVPLYEAAALAVLAIGFAIRPPREPGRGQRLRCYVLAYCCLRLALEALRGDDVRGVFIAGASAAQWVAGCALGLTLAIRSRFALKRFDPTACLLGLVLCGGIAHAGPWPRAARGPATLASSACSGARSARRLPYGLRARQCAGIKPDQSHPDRLSLRL
jgi:phosphatidylglycerol---prolipoprotein diacylglyceryl transferase